jgi:hypothetical protein
MSSRLLSERGGVYDTLPSETTEHSMSGCNRLVPECSRPFALLKALLVTKRAIDVGVASTANIAATTNQFFSASWSTIISVS